MVQSDEFELASDDADAGAFSCLSQGCCQTNEKSHQLASAA